MVTFAPVLLPPTPLNPTASRNTIAALTILALMIASAQNPLGSTLIAVALPSIGHDLGVDLVLATSLLVTSYMVVNIIAQGPGGRLADSIGHARTLWIGIGLYGVGALVGYFGPQFEYLAVSRSLMAVAGALVVPATLALLRLHVPLERRGRIFGWFSANMGFSAAIGPALGGEIVTHFGWRWVYLASLPFLAVAALLLRARPVPPPPPEAEQGRTSWRTLDFTGLALMGAALVLLVWASKEGGHRLAVLALAIACGAAFVHRQLRIGEPLLELRLFSIPAFSSGCGIIGLQNFAMYGLMFQLPQFFERFRGTAPREVGYTLFAMMIGIVFMSPVGGRLTDRIGARNASLIGTAVFIAGCLLLCRIASFDSPADAVPGLLLFGMGLGLCSAPPQSSLMSAVSPRQAGMAAGISSIMRYLGGIAGVLTMGVVLGSNESVSPARHVMVIVLFTVSVAVSGLLALRLPGRLEKQV